MALSVGIVGLPNVGKSTLFKALTKKQVDASNYPFCTIDPNVGVVAVPDERLDQLAKVSGSQKILPTAIEFVDIAGLVAGAHKGEGLGNKFLANIRNTDAIVQVLRHFTDKDVAHVHGKVDPESDKGTINLELIFADLSSVENRLNKNEKLARSNDKEAKELQPILLKLKQGLENEQLAINIITDEEEKALVKDLNLLTMKPMIYVLNVDEDNVFQETDYIAISAKIEADLSELSYDEAQEYLTELKLDSSGLDKLIRKAYETLNLITFFTSGPQEARAWTIKKGSKAPQAAGVIHTDFEKGFIRAEVINWQDFIECGGEVKAKEKGLIRLEGKDYVMADGDVCHFRFAT
ncbi:redox-regulated ATPase YchF [Candidatus Falkowbacteria bacterium]|uniref:Ribosome-binding ATPase YchF n=1 Tax=Candidatus Buchananbacteria bacterium CG10_big_fil_rev_8_21_14_0_10_33_19 TaxID=1974525 RepID=A0A2H0W6M1_9BACT|nr:redox-regulated ATPase YchF [Candidatus Falkowbacteria bacterium]PIS06290.1 MAG: redox-regulated ATPase YchF [Candidatus Buchananbacteria bacterium CG10_big_fil_rev_8_21_14_0_10_33_19]